MKRLINPSDTNRAQAFNLWMDSPMPMVTLTRTFNVTHIRRTARKRNVSFNMLLCWAIGKAAEDMEMFYLLPEQGKLYKFDSLAINVIVNNSAGGINSCDIPMNPDWHAFDADYRRLTRKVADECSSCFVDDAMVIGTSAMIDTEIDSIVNQYTDKFCNPMVMWGKYRKGWMKTTLPISFQFHHVQMDGGDGARFLERLQRVMNEI